MDACAPFAPVAGEDPALKHVLPWLLSLTVLSGCATGYRLDTAVQSFSSLPSLPPHPTYRFEWLPSQVGPEQARLEAMADAALFQALETTVRQSARRRIIRLPLHINDPAFAEAAAAAFLDISQH